MRVMTSLNFAVQIVMRILIFTGFYPFLIACTEIITRGKSRGALRSSFSYFRFDLVSKLIVHRAAITKANLFFFLTKQAILFISAVTGDVRTHNSSCGSFNCKQMAAAVWLK